MQGIMRVIYIAKSNDGDHFSSLFSRLLDRRYRIQIHSNRGKPLQGILVSSVIINNMAALRNFCLL